MNLNITSLNKRYEGLAMERHDLPQAEELQSALIGFTNASKGLLEKTKEAIDGIVKNLLAKNATLLKLKAETSMTQGLTASNSQSIADHLSDVTSKLININSEVDNIRYGLKLLIPSNNMQSSQPEHTQDLNKKLTECIKLNSRLYNQLTLLTTITGQANNLDLNKHTVDALNKQIGALINTNEEIRNKHLATRGFGDNVGKKIDELPSMPTSPINKPSR